MSSRKIVVENNVDFGRIEEKDETLNQGRRIRIQSD